MSHIAAAVAGITGVLSEAFGVALGAFEIKDRLHKKDDEMDELRAAVVSLSKRDAPSSP
jgi:hypothetical protein